MTLFLIRNNAKQNGYFLRISEAGGISVDLKETILRTLYSIKKRPGMYVVNHTDYARLTAYVEGFLLGAGVVGGEHGYSPRGLTNHYTEQHGKNPSSMVLSALITYTNPTMCDEEKCNRYLEAVIDYFENH